MNENDNDEDNEAPFCKRQKLSQKTSISYQYQQRKKQSLAQTKKDIIINPTTSNRSETPTIENDKEKDRQGEEEQSVVQPQRKKGLFLSGTAQNDNGSEFAAELEALRKESAGSNTSNLSSPNYKTNDTITTYHPPRMLRNKLSTTNDEFIKKMSTVSMEDSSFYSDLGDLAPETDSIPHINLGKNFQARVKKWAEREITAQERAALPDRDVMVFDASIIDHLPQLAIAAFETLACSFAVPRPGRNKELALHILMENQGNIEAAVMDLLRSDSLDWEQYPIIFNNRYVDTDNWSMKDINRFQDAIYRSEKDFHQVAIELGNRTVKECVAFYYTWKKSCPDDYRKLRNLRQKRQLLQQILIPQGMTLNEKQIDAHLARQTESDNDEEFSETESLESVNMTTTTNNTQQQHQQLNCSIPPMQPLNIDTTRVPLFLETGPNSFLNTFLNKSHQQQHSLPTTFQQQQQQHVSPTTKNFNNNNNRLNKTATNSPQFSATTTTGGGGYPWLHGENGMFPLSNTTTTNEISPCRPGGNSSTGASSTAGSLTDLSGEIGGSSSTSGNGGFPFLHKIRNTNNVVKKGAQPSADGFFHCRLCEKRFEKVKSLNAHMKSHAMKARAEAEAQAQHNKQQQINGNRFNNNSNNKSGVTKLTETEQQQLQKILNDGGGGSGLDEMTPLNLCQTSMAAALGLGPAGAAPNAAKINLLNALNAAATRQQQHSHNVINNDNKAVQQQFLANLQQTSLQQQLDMATHTNLLQQLHSNFN